MNDRGREGRCAVCLAAHGDKAVATPMRDCEMLRFRVGVTVKYRIRKRRLENLALPKCFEYFYNQ